MNWDNLKKTNCPLCGKKMRFRLEGSIHKIRVRKGADLKEDMYFCFKCNFQISKKRFDNISLKPLDGVSKEANKIFNEIINNVLKK